VPAVLCNNCAADLPDGSQFCLKCGQPVTGLPDAGTPPTIVSVACSKCGTDLVDGAEFCSKCGKPVSLPAKSPASKKTFPESLPAASVRVVHSRRAGRIFLIVLLFILIGGLAWTATSDNPFAQGIQELVGWKHDQTILETPFTVSGHNFRYYKFALPEGSMNVAIIGQFSAAAVAGKSDGRMGEKTTTDKTTALHSDNQIEVYVLSEPAFTVWQNGYAASSVYESGRVSQGTIESELPAGAGIYYLVFSNKFGAASANKTVNATVLLRYKSWLPESLRRAKDRFWNWVGL